MTLGTGMGDVALDTSIGDNMHMVMWGTPGLQHRGTMTAAVVPLHGERETAVWGCNKKVAVRGACGSSNNMPLKE